MVGVADVDFGRVSVVAGCWLVEASVGTVLVVVLDELCEEVMELALVPDQGPVEELVANGADPSLSEGIRLWSAGMGGDYVGGDGGEDVVEGWVYWPAPSRITNLIVLS